MKAFADTNWLVAAYFVNSRTPVVQRFSAKYGRPWHIALPGLVECHAVFPRLAQQAQPPQLNALKADLGAKLILEPLLWDDLERHALDLLSRYAHKAAISVMDAMLVSAAKVAQMELFLCFDANSNTRALAAAVKLNVFPDLTEGDKQKLADLRR